MIISFIEFRFFFISMSEKINYDNLSFTLAGRYFEGKQVVRGISLGLAATAVYGLRRYFTGGWCYLNKDLTGKNVVITGGNTGIGKQTAHRLLELGANVIIGARDEKKNKETVDELSHIGKGKILSYKLDLADKISIQNFAENVTRELGERPLHYLLNNAGIMALLDHRLTRDNLQMQIGVNHFGHFYLTSLLWEKLRQSGNPRIVNVSSLAHMSVNKSYDIDFNNIHYQNGGYDSFAAYSHSKKANILFTKQLQRRMTSSGVNGTVVCLHPGSVRTQLQKNYLDSWWRKGLAILMYPIILFTFKTATQGAQTNLYCLLEQDRNLVKGGYYSDCKLAKTSGKQVQDEQVARRLWVESERTFGIKFNV